MAKVLNGLVFVGAPVVKENCLKVLLPGVKTVFIACCMCSFSFIRFHTFHFVYKHFPEGFDQG